MLWWSLVFLIVAMIAGILGFTMVGTAAAIVAEIIFIVSLVLGIMLVVMGLTSKRSW